MSAIVSALAVTPLFALLSQMFSVANFTVTSVLLALTKMGIASVLFLRAIARVLFDSCVRTARPPAADCFFKRVQERDRAR